MFIQSCYVLILALAATNSLLADCNNAIPRTTPDQAFTLHNDGTVTHNTTGLMWMRCLVGQTWNGSTCSGISPGYTWQNALQTAKGFSFAGQNDWRLPNKNELVSIVERACLGPAINSTVFPDTDSRGAWSSTPSGYFRDYDYNSSGRVRDYTAWGVDFGYGSTIKYSKINEYEGLTVRLVRGGH